MKLWNLISNIGVLPTDTSDNLRKIHLINRISFLATFTTFFFAGHLALIGSHYYIYFQLLTGVLCCFNFMLCRMRKYEAAMYWLYFVIGTNVFYCSLENPNAGVEYFLIALGMISFTVIDSRAICMGLTALAAIAFLIRWHLSKTYVPHQLFPAEDGELTFIMTISATFLLCAVFIHQFKIVNYRYAHIISEQKQSLEEKTRDITDSINYAKRIQHAKLAKRESIHRALPSSFVLFKPKDIVSGDFYFFENKQEHIILAAADCTGHGVPGAFMSLIGIERLEDAVSRSSDPSTILSLLNKGVKVSLKQSDTDESTRDGMDIALCSIDRKNNRLLYAGANRPLWIIRKDSGSLEEIKATKTAIGGYTPDDQLFQLHEIPMKQGDRIYLFSDGYADQFSQQNKKLTTKKFKELLLSLTTVPITKQEEQLDRFIEDWKNGTEQIDDILVIGVEYTAG